MTESARLFMATLSDELCRSGAIRSREWADIFAGVPRHIFVPEWYEQELNPQGIAVWRLRNTDGDDSRMAAVYRDQTLVTAIDPSTAEQVDATGWTGMPTSSSTQPSLMAGMLEDLDVDEGCRILEIGTGTGYNSALLSARLGDRLVYSIDIDPVLLQTARERLAQIGYAPQLAVGDGQARYPSEETFDRIIATCSVPGIPAAWVEQTQPNGIILADVAFGIEGGLVRLSVDAEQRCRGGFTSTGGRFMAARRDARAYPRQQRSPYAPEAGSRPTTVTAADIRSYYPFRLLLAFQLPTTELVYHSDEGSGSMSLQLQQRDGSWARVPLFDDSTPTMTYGGSVELWEEVEAAWQWWNREGRPAQDQFGYARDAEGGHRAWYLPDGRRWDLAAP
ncbi:Protein-L-isoaspartate O-methyltransferase [Sinosporangium album]|uniref:Protein-L-isoaspartate O-methyltransferase n=1 Tax=Sinosporangium album TaxID=504805 RepID=A0A1G7VAJ2_9ACTN|nr:methyltransferase domain-containing protein [Sinosporangium album]SDG56747.1 Protein-L-isoaspartate O-methyltransferase [Sinosporangium album]